MQFALFFLAEYANSIAVGLLASTLFLGGYHTGLGDAFDNLIWPLLPGVLITKAAIIFLVFVWVRGTLPRFRYDQLMQFAWKRMLPVSLALVSLSALFASLSSLLGPIIWPAESVEHKATNGIRSGGGQGHADHDQPPREAARHHPVP